MKKEYIRTIEERKKVILKVLEQFGRMPTTKLSFIGFGHTEYEIIFDALEELLKEKKINKEVETNATYWSLNKT